MRRQLDSTGRRGGTGLVCSWDTFHPAGVRANSARNRPQSTRTGLERLVETWTTSGSKEEVPKSLLTGIALSRDSKYLPLLKKVAAKADDSNEVREVLKWVRGMRGPQARKFRREINKRIREKTK